MFNGRVVRNAFVNLVPGISPLTFGQRQEPESEGRGSENEVSYSCLFQANKAKMSIMAFF